MAADGSGGMNPRSRGTVDRLEYGNSTYSDLIAQYQDEQAAGMAKESLQASRMAAKEERAKSIAARKMDQTFNRTIKANAKKFRDGVRNEQAAARLNPPMSTNNSSPVTPNSITSDSGSAPSIAQQKMIAKNNKLDAAAKRDQERLFKRNAKDLQRQSVAENRANQKAAKAAQVEATRSSKAAIQRQAANASNIQANGGWSPGGLAEMNAYMGGMDTFNPSTPNNLDAIARKSATNTYYNNNARTFNADSKRPGAARIQGSGGETLQSLLKTEQTPGYSMDYKHTPTGKSGSSEQWMKDAVQKRVNSPDTREMTGKKIEFFEKKNYERAAFEEPAYNRPDFITDSNGNIKKVSKFDKSYDEEYARNRDEAFEKHSAAEDKKQAMFDRGQKSLEKKFYKAQGIKGNNLNQLKRDQGFSTEFVGPREDSMSKNFGRMMGHFKDSLLGTAEERATKRDLARGDKYLGELSGFTNKGDTFNGISNLNDDEIKNLQQLHINEKAKGVRGSGEEFEHTYATNEFTRKEGETAEELEARIKEHKNTSNKSLFASEGVKGWGLGKHAFKANNSEGFARAASFINPIGASSRELLLNSVGIMSKNQKLHARMGSKSLLGRLGGNMVPMMAAGIALSDMADHKDPMDIMADELSAQSFMYGWRVGSSIGIGMSGARGTSRILGAGAVRSGVGRGLATGVLGLTGALVASAAIEGTFAGIKDSMSTDSTIRKFSASVRSKNVFVNQGGTQQSMTARQAALQKLSRSGMNGRGMLLGNEAAILRRSHVIIKGL